MVLVHELEMNQPFDWSDIPVACDGDCLALPISKAVVGVWSIHSLSSEPLHLVGHHKTVSALCLGYSSFPRLLCSASQDYVIIWDIQKARLCHERGETIRGTVVATCPGNVHSVGFNPEDNILAAAVEKEVLILSAKIVEVITEAISGPLLHGVCAPTSQYCIQYPVLTTEKLIATLEGHTAMVTGVQFCPHYNNTLLSISEDRTFKVWNIQELSLVYQSSIVSSSPFISIAMNPNKEQVAIGTTDGQVRIYDLTDGHGFRCLHQADVTKIVSRLNRETAETSAEQKGPVTVSSRPVWQRNTTESHDSEINLAPEDETERGCVIMGMCYTYQGEITPTSSSIPSFLRRENTAVREMLTPSPSLFIGTSSGLLQVNAFTLDVIKYWSFQDPVFSVLDHCNRTVMTAGSVYLTQGQHNKVWCVAGSLFQRKLHVLSCNLMSEQNTKASVELSGETNLCQQTSESLSLSEDKDLHSSPEITILSNAPLLEDSILKSELIPKQKEGVRHTPGKGKISSPAGKKLSASVSDQPLTFKSKVKSSGYTQAPRKGMFNPQTSASKGRSPKTKPAQSLSERLLLKEYPVESQPPVHLQTSQSIAERPTPVNSLTFSDDGHSLVCGLGNKAVQEFRIPLTGKGTAFTGHDGPVTWVHCSHSNQRLLSSSEDHSAWLWVRGQSEPLLIIDKVNNNFSAQKEGVAVKTVDKDNPRFGKDVRCAQFYYVDKFILLASGNSVHMYKYHIDPTKEDIKRYLTKSRYKLVKSFPLDQAQSVMVLKAVNSFHSYVTLAAGSDKSISIYDLNVGKVLRRMENVHTKQCHAICLNEGSSAVSHPASVYDLFVTAAMTDCIKLWDIRSNRCVRRYEGHQNRSYPCGLDLSPCGRFLATGAEDKSAYIFDLRAGTYLHKLTGHTDVVSDVTFHPIKPQLVTGCLDGKIRVFTDS